MMAIRQPCLASSTIGATLSRACRNWFVIVAGSSDRASALPPRAKTAVGKKVLQASPRLQVQQVQNLVESRGSPSVLSRLFHARPNSDQSPPRNAESACCIHRRASSNRPVCAGPGGAGTVAPRRLLHASLRVRPAPSRLGAATLTHANTVPPDGRSAK